MRKIKGGIKMPSFLERKQPANNTIPMEIYLKRAKDVSVDIGLMCVLGTLCVGFSVVDFFWKKWPRFTK